MATLYLPYMKRSQLLPLTADYFLGYINKLTQICEETEVDIQKIRRAT